MVKPSKQEEQVEETWRAFLSAGEHANEQRQRHFFAFLPGDHRCKFCFAPFDGISAYLTRIIFNKRPSNMNPNLCTVCEDFASENLGGTEIELSMLFADVRGSTSLAEEMSATKFSKLINRFYTIATGVLIQEDAIIDKIIGDQVTGLFVPGLAGPDHAMRAVVAAQEIMHLTGHGEPDGPWIPIGAGVHTGIAFVGAVGSKDGTMDITVLGDEANTAARLSSRARQGEILVSEATSVNEELKLDQMDKRLLDLKGKREPVSVYVLTDYGH